MKFIQALLLGLFVIGVAVNSLALECTQVLKHPHSITPVSPGKENLQKGILYTKRLMIRPVYEDYHEAMSAIFTDPRVEEMSKDVLDYGAARNILENVTTPEQFRKDGYSGINFGIFDKKNFLGFIRIEDPTNSLEIGDSIHPGFQALNQEIGRTIRLHGIVHPSTWNQGVTSEALARIIRYSFEYLRVKNIYGKAAVTNKGSLRVMENNGMVKSKGAPDGPVALSLSPPRPYDLVPGVDISEFSYSHRFLSYKMYMKNKTIKKKVIDP